jgi:hypothetical protein
VIIDMRATLRFGFVVFVLGLCAEPCFGDWGIERVGKKRAGELGVEVRARPLTGTEVWIELEMKSVRTREDGQPVTAVRVDLQVLDGDACLTSATLKDERPAADRVLVRFSARRDQLGRIAVRLWVPEWLGGTIHELRLQDFVAAVAPPQAGMRVKRARGFVTGAGALARLRERAAP